MSFNSYWYLGLAAISVALLTFVYFKTRNYRSLLLYLGMVGVGYLIEYVIYVLFESYQYYPKLITRDAYYDSNMGSIASNFFSLPVSATIIAVFRLRWVWIIVFSGLFSGIEWLFLELKIFRHIWWHISYTTISLPFYYILAKIWFPRMMLPTKGILQFLTSLLITGSVLATLQFIPIAFFNSRSYSVGWFENPSRDTTAFATVLWLCLSLVYIIVLNVHWKHTWLKYVIPITLLIILIITLQKVKIMKCHVWWDPYYCILICIIVLLFAEAIRKRLLQGPVPE